MKPHYRKIHSDFKLNGISYSRDDLKEVGYSLIKEGEPFERAIGNFLLDWTDDQPTLEVQTSGSTGKPKPIALQKRHMVNSALATGDFFGLVHGDTALLCLPADYIAGKMMLVRAMVLGLELDYVEPSPNPLKDISQCYDFCAMVPLQLENSMDTLGQIKTLIVGGAPLSDKVQRQLQAQALAEQVQKTRIFETYGMTETITHVAAKKINTHGTGEVADHGHGSAEALPHNTSFKTLPSVTVSSDHRGCLVVDAPKITDAVVITNDVVNLVSKTEFEWLGRYDHVINSGGVKLFPEQIEAKLAPVIPSRFFVTGLPDEKLGRKMVLVVEGRVEECKLREEIESLKTLEKFEVPKEIYLVSEFRETESGKIQRGETLKRITQNV